MFRLFTTGVPTPSAVDLTLGTLIVTGPKLNGTAVSYSNYRKDLFRRLWSYRETRYRHRDYLFDPAERSDNRPPVFLAEHAAENIAIDPGRHLHSMVVGEIPLRSRHVWFRSMRSSQALAQSVFGYLKRYDRLLLLASIRDEQGLPLFFDRSDVPRPDSVTLEKDMHTLGERRATSVDVLFQGTSQLIAVECKLAEEDFGCCSRPLLRRSDPTYAKEYCDGRYLPQRGRTAPCSLTELGIRYWDHIPKLLTWNPEDQPDPCPLRETYQLVRNLLAACVQADGRVDPQSGHAVVVYDARNPAFQAGGAADATWRRVTDSLVDRRTVRRCSWQRIISEIRNAPEMTWLVDELEQKYGLRPEDA